MHRLTVILSLMWYDVRIHQGVLRFASEHDWHLLCDPHMSSVPSSPRVDGLIVLWGPKDRARERLLDRHRGIPKVDVGNYHPDWRVPRVLPDNRQVGRQAAECLLRRGFQHFATFEFQRFWFGDLRRDGFIEALADAGHAPTCLRWTGAIQGARARRAHQLWLSKQLVSLPRPLGAFMMQDREAAELVEVCRGDGLSVPEEISVVGVNNDPLICPYTAVPLSSVDLGWEAIGYQAGVLLHRQIAGERVKGVNELLPPAGVVERQSTDTLAVDDLRVARALRYLWDHHHEAVSVTDVAAAVGVPVRTLQWAFRRHLGRGIKDELVRCRIDRVKQQLRQTDKTASQIAEELGFSSEHYLFRLFKRHTGMTTRQYRLARRQPR